MRYDVYNTLTRELILADVPNATAVSAENYGYRGTPGSNLHAVDHGDVLDQPYQVDVAMCGDEFSGSVEEVASYLTANGYPATAVSDPQNGAVNDRAAEPPESVWLAALVAADGITYRIATDGYRMFSNVPHCTPEVGCFGGPQPKGLTFRQASEKLAQLENTGDWPDGRPEYWIEKDSD
jgi:hypothetical protein